MRNGLFIVYEGGEGVGKTTQSQQLAVALARAGRPPIVTREPGGTADGAAIRKVLLDSPIGSLSPKAEALLYAADRAQHVDTLVWPALAAGEVVVSDRYIDSSIAYQAAGRELSVTDVAGLSAWATGHLRPDLTVVLDIDPTVGLARAARRGRPDRIEAETLDFHQRVRDAFLALAAADPDRYLVVDATLAVAVITETVLARVLPMLCADVRAGQRL